MVITPASILSCLMSSALLIFLSWAVLRNEFVLNFVGKYIFLFLIAILIRMALPIEFRFTKTFNSKHIMTFIMDILNLEIRIGNHSISIMQAFIALWITGGICRLLVTVKKYALFSYVIRKLPGYFKGNVHPLMDRINSEYGEHKAFQVLLMPGIGTPAIFGLIRPKILMPETGYTENELYYILKHEMLHFYQHDMLVKLFCEALCIIYWWNPCIFLLRNLIAKTVEFNVDYSVTRQLDEQEKRRYLECILKSMKSARRTKTDFIITFTNKKKSVMAQRFECILDNRWQITGTKRPLIAALLIVLFSISLLTLVEPYYDIELPGTFAQPTPETSYLIKTDGHYEIYMDGKCVGSVSEITDPLSELKIYDMETLNNESKK